MRFEHRNIGMSPWRRLDDRHHGHGGSPDGDRSSFSMANLTENMSMVGWAPISFILNSGTPWRRALSQWFHIISPQKLIFWRETDRRLFTKIRHTLDIQLWRLNISTYQPISWVWTCVLRSIPGISQNAVTAGRRRFQIPFFPWKPLAETIRDESPKRHDDFVTTVVTTSSRFVTIRHDIVTIRHDIVTIRHDILGFCKIYRDFFRVLQNLPRFVTTASSKMNALCNSLQVTRTIAITVMI